MVIIMTPFFFAWLFPKTILAQPTATLDGYVESRHLYFSQGRDRFQSVQRIRPRTTIFFSENISLHTTLDLSLWQGRDETNEIIELIQRPVEDSVPPSFDGFSWTFAQINEECDWGLYENPSVISVQSFFDRLHLDLQWNQLDLRIGRQALSWGSALFINPSDPIPQTLIETPWQERTGFDAVYISHPLGNSRGTVDLFGTVDQIAGKFSFFFSSWEGSLIGIAEKDRRRWGLNLMGDNIIGWWGEFAWHQEEVPYLKANIGIDYTFPILDGLWVFSQLVHDGSGQIPALYEWNKRPFVDSLFDCPSLGIDVVDVGYPQRETLGRWYTLSGQKLLFFENWSAQSVLFFNLQDNTGIHSQLLAWKGDSFAFHVGIQHRFGQQGEFAPPSLQTTFMGEDLSESVPDWRIISWLRYSFAR